MPQKQGLHAKDAHALLQELVQAREDDATYYVELILILLRRCNDVEGCPDRPLGELLREMDSLQQPDAPNWYPPDDVLLAEPAWRSKIPAPEGWTRQESLTLAQSLARAAENWK